MLLLMCRYALINRISMPFSESDLSRISTYVKTDFKVNNIMTVKISMENVIPSCENVSFSIQSYGFLWMEM